MAEARVSVSLTEGKLELEGSESFVGAQLEKFADLIRLGLTASTRADVRKEKTAGHGADDHSAPAGPASELDEVFAVSGDSIQILKDIPGASKPEKTVNAAKLYLYGRHVMQQKETALFEEIRGVCKAHGFYDSANMASYLKDDKESFVFGGSGKKQTLKLTVPGTKSAVKLVADLKGGSGGSE